MGLLEVKNLSFKYDNQIENVFNNVSFNIDTNWKLGLIGRNGKGKTTLLDLLMSKYRYQGYITPNYCFEYFPYDIKDKSMFTLDIVNEIVLDFELWQLQRELSLLEVEDDVLWRPFETLSNGEQTKVMLAALFLKPHDLLLIDEPTNHLDLHGRVLLSNYLKKKKSFILVSHDRNFLDNCIDHVLALNRDSIDIIKGNFTTWYQQKENQDNLEIKKNEKLKKDIKKLQVAARQTGIWSDKVEKSKNTRVSGIKPDKGYVGHKAAKMMQRSKNLQRRQNKAVEEKKGLLKDIETIEPLKMQPINSAKHKLVNFENVSITYENRTIVKNINFSINQGERINLSGANGSGKTSIIKLIVNEDANYQGKVTISPHLKIAYLSQSDEHLKGTLDDYIINEDLDHSLFKTILRKLDFSRDLFTQDISTFSKGQKKKVMLANCLATPANLYIFDEPLNYLDIFTRIQIEEVILKYQPTLLFVEHDQYFCNAIKTKTINLSND